MPKPIWGAATSAHQVEGGNRQNDWWAWEKAGHVKESSGACCDQYRLFRKDFQLARSLGHTAHRFSLEWSRLEPREGEWDEEAFGHYEAVFDALEEERLEPVVTLHHFTNPQWFSEGGGWLQKKAAEKFSAYVERVARRFGKRARIWITINEPLIYVYQGFVAGKWPPGRRSFREALRVIPALLGAHTQAYQILHRESKDRECYVSMAHHCMALDPCRPGSWTDRLSVWMREHFVNRLPFEAAQKGFLFFPGIFFEKLAAKKTLDFLGINYYSRDFVRFGGFRGADRLGTVCAREHHCGETVEQSDLGWEIYPEGLYRVLQSFKSFGLPALVTENGISTGDDRQRERFIASHLEQLERAREAEIEIFGYFYWSLVDNFEWAEGFKPRFGIVEVDYATERRSVRPSAQVLRQNCERIFSKI